MATDAAIPCPPSAYGHHRPDFVDLNFRFRRNAAGRSAGSNRTMLSGMTSRAARNPGHLISARRDLRPDLVGAFSLDVSGARGLNSLDHAELPLRDQGNPQSRYP